MNHFILIISAKNVDCLVAAGHENLPENGKRHPGMPAAAVQLRNAHGLSGALKINRASLADQALLVEICLDNKIISEALRTGCGCYLIPSKSPVTLVEIVRDAPGEAARTPVLTMCRTVKPPQTMARTRKHFPTLSGREMEVLTFLARGFKYREIAMELAIEPETVRCHVKKFCRKLSVRNRTEAVAKYCASRMHDDSAASPGITRTVSGKICQAR